jgi:hypothetical protein
MIKNATVVKTMTLWLTTQLLGDEELDFSKPPRMKKGNFKLHVHAMQYELKHGRDDDGNHRDPDCVVTLSKTAPVRNMFEAIERFHGLRMQQETTIDTIDTIDIMWPAQHISRYRHS